MLGRLRVIAFLSLGTGLRFAIEPTLGAMAPKLALSGLPSAGSRVFVLNVLRLRGVSHGDSLLWWLG
jgi:hypothetical protein